jgi:hypothetical protein
LESTGHRTRTILPPAYTWNSSPGLALRGTGTRKVIVPAGTLTAPGPPLTEAEEEEAAPAPVDALAPVATDALPSSVASDPLLLPLDDDDNLLPAFRKPFLLEDLPPFFSTAGGATPSDELLPLPLPLPLLPLLSEESRSFDWEGSRRDNVDFFFLTLTLPLPLPLPLPPLPLPLSLPLPSASGGGGADFFFLPLPPSSPLLGGFFFPRPNMFGKTNIIMRLIVWWVVGGMEEGWAG